MTRGRVVRLVVFSLFVAVALVVADAMSPWSIFDVCDCDRAGRAAWHVLGVNIDQGLIMALGIVTALVTIVLYRAMTKGNRYRGHR